MASSEGTAGPPGAAAPARVLIVDDDRTQVMFCDSVLPSNVLTYGSAPPLGWRRGRERGGASSIGRPISHHLLVIRNAAD